MNIQTITKKFNAGIRWNAFFFAIRKSLSTVVLILLYRRLPTNVFSIWANLYSALFLLLLWLDFGFKKSLPRFCPIFSKNKNALKKFIRYIVLFQSVALVVALPLFAIVTKYITTRYNTLLDKSSLFYLGCMLFITEGILAVFRLIFHSRFWQKQFNSKMALIVTVKTVIIMLLIVSPLANIPLLQCIFLSDIAAGLIAIFISIAMLRSLYKDKDYPGNEPINFKKTTKAFAKHSAIMWINNNLKSLTERNFLLLFFTNIFGPGPANAFKVANDGALFFYRTIKKTIGTTDTALLAHVETLPQKSALMPQAFTNLTMKIARLSIPLLSILCIVILNFKDTFFTNQFIFNAFCLITICYLIESLLSPYERMLEVKRNYWMLLVAYIPYSIIILLFLFPHLLTQVGLLSTIIIIHVLRLLSYLIMIYFNKKTYLITFPVKAITKMLATVIPLVFLASLLIKYFK